MKKIKDYFNSNTGFSILALCWVALAVIAPIICINDKYKLFEKTDDRIKFTGWFLVILIIVFIGLYALCNYIISAYSTKWRYWIQILKGIQKIVLPLALFYLACDVANENIVNIKIITLEIILCESLAILINPFPHFVYTHKVKDIKDILK